MYVVNTEFTTCHYSSRMCIVLPNTYNSFLKSYLPRIRTEWQVSKFAARSFGYFMLLGVHHKSRVHTFVCSKKYWHKCISFKVVIPFWSVWSMGELSHIIHQLMNVMLVFIMEFTIPEIIQNCTSQCRKWNSIICGDVKLYQLRSKFIKK